MHYSIHIFFFTHTSPSEFYTLSLHDALPIFEMVGAGWQPRLFERYKVQFECLHATRRWDWATRAIRVDAMSQAQQPAEDTLDRKSTRLNSSHRCISYAVFCLKKKKSIMQRIH